MLCQLIFRRDVFSDYFKITDILNEDTSGHNIHDFISK